ncbi:MAG: alpha-galactosidase [Bacteroidia bacterium]|nr:alpha-galactosidase [Bacteroidia bacterium]
MKISVIKVGMYFKKSILMLILFILFMSQYKANGFPKPNVSPNGIEVHQWVKQHFAKGKIPPFSFVYGGKSSESFIKDWQYSAEKIKSTDPNVEEDIYTYSDKQSGLVVKCNVTLFNDFQAVEWVLKLTNNSERNSPLIERAAVIDYSFISKEKGSFILHHAKGSDAKMNDFQPIDETLQIGKNIYMTPAGGRSSDNTAFPFFNIETPGQQGIMVAVGWTGKWYADVLQANEKTVSLKSGMEKMQLALYPKEEIRSPKICLLFWKGKDRMVGHNQFRQFVLVHHTRKIDGKHVELPFSTFLAREGPPPCNEHTCATESFSVAMINRHQQFNIVPEVFWLDAGWYACNGAWWKVGNWTPNIENFPNGLKPVTDAAHKVGAKFLLWFEPERVTKNTQFADKNPEWLLNLSGKDNALFNLGNNEARLWLTNYISDFLKKEGVDYYRQDFNFDPMPYWKANDKPDRTGISEIRHIEGLYAFWDSLLVRFPHLIIDNCSSGGRRIDLETISRSSPLWRTDYQYGEPDGSQNHTYGLNFYLPLHGTGNFNITPYHFRSNMSSSMVINWDINSKLHSMKELQKYFLDFKRLRPYYYGDYYPLTGTESMLQDNVWIAYQLNRQEQGDGIITAFRRKNCNDKSLTVQLRGVDPKENYELIDEDSQVRISKTGEELMKGFTLNLNDKPGSLVIMYKKTQ